MEFLSSVAGALKFGVANLAWILVVLWGVERLWPRGPRPTPEQCWRAMFYWLILMVIGALVGTVFALIKGDALPLYYFPVKRWLEGSWTLYIIGPLAFDVLYDFFNYWMHRAQHKWFWKQHSVHHSIENLSGLNSYFHWSEDLFRIAFISAPMAFLLGLDPGKSVVAVTIFTTMHGMFLHSSTRLHFGPFGYLLADNRWHRVHHSVEPRHFDRNFGTSVTIWDHLFGTAHVPAKDEWPDTGVHDMPEAKTLSDFLWRPFRQVRGYAAVGTEKPLSEA